MVIKKLRRKSNKFTKKLTHMLTFQESIFHWDETGRFMIVEDYKQFEEKVMGHFLRHCNFFSFIRQLNIYGFSKSVDDEFERKIYFTHPDFNRDNLDFCLARQDRQHLGRGRRDHETMEGLENDLQDRADQFQKWMALESQALGLSTTQCQDLLQALACQQTPL